MESVHWCDIILENKTLRTSWMVSFSTESIACCTVDASRRLLIAKNHSITIYNHDGYCHEVELCNIFKSCSTDKISSVVDNAVHLGSNNHSRLTLLVSFTSGKYCCVDVSLLKWEITRVTDLYAFDLFAWNMRHHHCLPFLNCSEEMTLLNCYNSNQNIFVVFGVAKLFGYELIGLAADPIMYSPQMSIPLDDVCHLTAVGRTVFAGNLLDIPLIIDHYKLLI